MAMGGLWQTQNPVFSSVHPIHWSPPATDEHWPMPQNPRNPHEISQLPKFDCQTHRFCQCFMVPFFLSCLARIWVLHGKLTILFRLSPNFSKWNSQFLHGEIRICPAFFHRIPYQKVWAPKDLSKPNSASRNVMVTSLCKSTPARRKATCLVSTSFTMTSPAGQIVFFFTTFMGHEMIILYTEIAYSHLNSKPWISLGIGSINHAQLQIYGILWHWVSHTNINMALDAPCTKNKRF